MEVLLLLPLLVGLVSARCNNIITSGCRQDQPYNLLYSRNYGFQQPYVPEISSSYPKRTCLSVDVFPLPLKETLCGQSTYTKVLDNSAENRLRDNTCTTFFPVLDDDKSVIAYMSTVFTDGSNKVESLLYTEISPGIYIIANADFTVMERIPAFIEGNIVSCFRTEFGESTFAALSVSTVNSPNPLGYNCVRQIQEIFDCSGLSQCEGLYVLPYRLPPRCITQPNCFSNNPLLPLIPLPLIPV